jgi:hypothetical protein
LANQQGEIMDNLGMSAVWAVIALAIAIVGLVIAVKNKKSKAQKGKGSTLNLS